MTKEEIRQAAQKEFAHQIEIGSKAPLSVQEGFIKGAEWMQEKMIEKAVEWMRNFKDGQGNFPLYDYVGNFKQAMEE